jgi:SAM-dependent methyltransferase
MIGTLPLPLPDATLDALAAIARHRRLPSLDEPSKLAPHVAALAAAYNDDALRGLGPGRHLAAKLGFYFVRDVPKVAGAAREAIALGRLRLDPKEPLRVLDLGAGLGASHRGLARALDAAGHTGTLDVLALDQDEAALELLRDVAKLVPREGGVSLHVRADVRPMDRVTGHKARARFDVILLGQVLTELDLDLATREREGDRVQKHLALVRALAGDLLADDGTILIVEPALKPRARHLQRLRDAIVSLATTTAPAREALSIVAPCLHRGRCPLLGREADWCHEDLPIDLPPRLIPIAKAAGLRWEGLTFSYLALGARGPTLGDALHAALPAAKLVRGVSGALVSKGKRELVVCGDPLREQADEAYGPHGARVGRLDREESRENAPFAEAGRGDLLALHAPLDDKGRVRREHAVTAVGEVPPSAPATESP